MSSQLGGAARKGDVVTLIKLLAAGADAEWTHKGTGRTALLEAAIAAKTDVVATLLKWGANIDHQCAALGYTALTWASVNGSRDTVELLIEHGANLDMASPEMRRTALMAAAQAGHTEVVKLLLSAGSDANLTDFQSENAWSLAKAKQHVSVMRLLEEAGVDVPPQREVASVIPWPESAPGVAATSDPAAVVRAYALAIYAWERRGHSEFREGSASAAFFAEADQVRTRFCTQRTRAYTRTCYGWPPEYAPGDELVSVKDLSARKAEVVIRDAETRSTRYEHCFVVKRIAGEWRIDIVKSRMYGLEKWERNYL